MNNTKDSIERKRIISSPAISVSKILNIRLKCIIIQQLSI